MRSTKDKATAPGMSGHTRPSTPHTTTHSTSEVLHRLVDLASDGRERGPLLDGQADALLARREAALVLLVLYLR